MHIWNISTLQQPTEFFLTSQQSLSWRTFLKPEGLLPRSQEPAIEPYQNLMNPVHIFPVSFKNTLISSLQVSSFNDVCISHFCHACHILRLSHSPWFDHMSSIRWRVVYKQWSSSLRNFLQCPVISCSFRIKYAPKHSRHTPSIYAISEYGTRFHTTQNTR